MTERVLVTGGTGYIAGWCIAELLQRGYEVRTTVRSAEKGDIARAAVATVVDPRNRLSIATADLTSDGEWDTAVAGVDYVLHVASPLGNEHSTDPDELIVPARDGALRVLRAATAAGVERVVITSAANAASPSSYADEGITDESLWTDPNDPTLIPYRRSKTLAEKAAWEYMAGYEGLTTLTTILPGAVRPDPEDQQHWFGRDHRADGPRQHAGHAPDWPRGRRRPGSRGHPHPGHDLSRGCRTTVPPHRRISLDARHRPNAACRARRRRQEGTATATARPRVRTRRPLPRSVAPPDHARAWPPKPAQHGEGPAGARLATAARRGDGRRLCEEPDRVEGDLEVPLAGGEDHIERVEGRGRNRELGAIGGAEPVENKRQVATPQLGR